MSKMILSGKVRGTAAKDINLPITPAIDAGVTTIKNAMVKAGLRTPSVPVVVAVAVAEYAKQVGTVSPGELVLAVKPVVAAGSMFAE